jgi:hypothetical protein
LIGQGEDIIEKVASKTKELSKVLQ